jgi:hypothetical protein
LRWRAGGRYEAEKEKDPVMTPEPGHGLAEALYRLARDRVGQLRAF